MDLFDLDDLIYDLGIEPTKSQLELIYQEFERDFINDNLEIDGLNVKVVLHNSNVLGFEDYPETFVHLITRKSNAGKRVFDKHRANKIHWIRCILENRFREDIIYFEYPENENKLRNYFWYKEKGFLVIMEKIVPEYLIITSFNIDCDNNQKYFDKKYKWYLNQLP